MPRYAFTPIPIRLPLSDVAALAQALAFGGAPAPPAGRALPCLTLAFRLAASRAARALTANPGDWTAHDREAYGSNELFLQDSTQIPPI